MTGFLYALTHFPGIVPSILIGALMFFWLLAILGMLDFHTIGPDWLGGHEVHGGHEFEHDAPTSLMALGLDRLPFSIVLSGVAFFWWLLTMLLAPPLLPLIPLPPWIAGSVLLLAALVASLPLAAITLKPLKPLFVMHAGPKQETVLGKPCRILTLTVSERFGQAEVAIGTGAPLNVKVYSDQPNTLTKGSTALIIDLDAERGRYLVQPYTPPS